MLPAFKGIVLPAVYTAQTGLLFLCLFLKVHPVIRQRIRSLAAADLGPASSGQQVDDHEERQVEEKEKPQVQPVGLPRQRHRLRPAAIVRHIPLLPPPRLRLHVLEGRLPGPRYSPRRLQLYFRVGSQWERSARIAVTPCGQCIQTLPLLPNAALRLRSAAGGGRWELVVGGVCVAESLSLSLSRPCGMVVFCPFLQAQLLCLPRCCPGSCRRDGYLLLGG
ncbi:uncharacterized protein LOC134168176 [Pezoporus occidentalis]|uniref:uncharacterized protein LOC134168176 n=1 Tax=Pezoporus occidentalis TaxID=407982 RepID=UPI002F912F0A